MVRQEYAEILCLGEEGKGLSLSEIRFLFTVQNAGEMQRLFDAADRVREKHMGPEVHLRAIVEFSNHCRRNCLYCGLRKENPEISRYRMSDQEILKVSLRARKEGFETLVLQSGEDPWFTQERLSTLIREVKRETHMTITLSVGERAREDYAAWREAGADRYLLKYETGAPELFRRLRPGCELEARLRCLRHLRSLDYEVGSGNIVGLPGQTVEDLAADISLFSKYDFDMIGIGPFIPHPATPLGSHPIGNLDISLMVLAITRIVTRNTNLPATTAASILDPDGRKKGLMAGANIIMPDFTPSRFRRHYEIYPGKGKEVGGMDGILALVSAIGRTIGRGPGSRKNKIQIAPRTSSASGS